ncbi:MAG: hypothetical protein M3209_15085 [Acidobacteriota bacterium]|nr:hypothetical protein [Acidobacteriota bacterium]
MVLKYLSVFLPANTTDLGILARFLILAFSILFASFQLANWMGKVSERGIDSFSELSYVKLNRGDEKEIKIAERKNQHYILKAIGGVTATLIFGIISSLIADYISKQ